MRCAVQVIWIIALMAANAKAEVMVRWRQGTLPPRDALGVAAVVVPAGSALGREASEKGYRVAVEGDAAIAVDDSGRWPRIRPNFRMRDGRPVQVASRTAQPWIDNNVALIRMLEAAGRRPVLAYPWKPAIPGDPQDLPSADDYALAIAEAGAFGADLVLDVDEKSLTAWYRARRHLDYYARKRAETPIANVGILPRDPAEWYEVLNLLARHNVPYRILAPTGRLRTEDLDLVILAEGISAPSGLPPERMLRAGEDAADPNAFALKVRNVLGRKRRLADIWNGITVLTSPRRGENGILALELVNYSIQSLPVQVRVKGAFRRVEYARPEAAAQTLVVEILDGFTEFVVPELRIGGTVSLLPNE